MILNTLPNAKNPSFFLPCYRGDGQRIQNIKPIFFPCHRGNTKGSYNGTDTINCGRFL